MNTRKYRPKSGAFTLIELLVVIAIIGILAALLLPVLSSAMKKAVKTTCLNNLKQMGLGMHMYVHDSEDKLPYAAIRMTFPTRETSCEMTWDSLLNRYIGGQQTEDQLWNPVAGLSLKYAKALPVLKCPSDATPRPTDLPPEGELHRRSYAMPRYMDFMGKLPEGGRAPWPPTRDTQRGIGLTFSPLSPFWNKADDQCNDGSPGKPRPSHQAAIKMNLLPEPAKTIALTERIHVQNVMGFATRHDIRDANDHMGLGKAPVDPPYFYPPASSLHGGRFNYLMTDGHVEFLLPEKTTSDLGLQRGMWSIKAGD